jgi:hypothetical protein
MEEIPCKDCLCFPACKSQAIRTNIWVLNLNILADKCIIFKEWYELAAKFSDARKAVIDHFVVFKASW